MPALGWTVLLFRGQLDRPLTLPDVRLGVVHQGGRMASQRLSQPNLAGRGGNIGAPAKDQITEEVPPP